MKKIKLVIWDLDETFWYGTISEESIVVPKDNIRVVQELTNRGIVNSICSKNDFETVKDELNKLNIFNLFVFNSITWEPKGQRIKQIIEDMNLRAENVLFLDDNHLNLNEALYYNPKLNVEAPAFIDKLLNHAACQGKEDLNHTRLKQYQLLETKREHVKAFTSNVEFLKSSNIKLIFENPQNHIDRLFELSDRSNQLNYTKYRSSIEEIKKYIDDANFEIKCFRIVDDFGDYGIAGFYVLKEKRELIEFVFSCRILNMGVPSFIFQKLGSPKLEIKGDVSEGYQDTVDWIAVTKKRLTKPSNSAIKKEILLIGGCDLEQTANFLVADFKLHKEFNYLNGNIPLHRDHSIYLANQELKEVYLSEQNILDRVPFFDMCFFNSKVDSDKCSIIVYSVLIDYTQGIYKYKYNGRIRLSFGEYEKPITDSNHFEYYKTKYQISDEFLRWFASNFVFEGRISEEEFKYNIKKIVSKKKDAIVFLNGAIKTYGLFGEKKLYYEKMNKVLSNVVFEYTNVGIMDINKIVSKPEDFTDHINHYSRAVHYEIAIQIGQIVKNLVNVNIQVRKSQFGFFFLKYQLKYLYYYLKAHNLKQNMAHLLHGFKKYVLSRNKGQILKR